MTIRSKSALKTIPSHANTIEQKTVLILAMVCGVTIANGYYNQPLLAQISRSFAVSVQQVGLVPTFSQMGIALGMVLLLPLGDIVESRRLMIAALGVTTCALVGSAIAPNIHWLYVTSFATGFTTLVPYLIPPFVAHLAAPQERGKMVGMVASGVFIGILLARTVSGLIGDSLGWRSVYWLASGLMVATALVLAKFLPKSQPSSTLSYGQLLRSLGKLIKEQPRLREASLTQALLFGSFNVFWTTLIFLLESPPYHYGSQVAGLFGLVGVVGASAAPLVGRMSDRKGPRLAVGLAVVIILSSWVVLWVLGYQLWGLIVGVTLLDLGLQAGHVSNQSLIFSLLPNARSRLNTVYGVTNFIGAALGSLLAAWSWSMWQWNGVCFLGLSLSMIALIIYFKGRRRKLNLLSA